jgi:predicted nucleotidyltransferase
MRLSETERQIISQTIHQADAAAAVYLYGSRVEDEAKGGDIDLLVLSQKIDLMKKLDILAQLHRRLGERKIDLTICPDATRPFAKLAIQSGIRI